MLFFNSNDSLVGLKPTLRLKTADGFAYEESDLVAVAVEQSMILATVLEWQISPLGQRYEEMCIQLHRGITGSIFFDAIIPKLTLNVFVFFCL